jgi:predicted DNA-binding protein (MmcQ/YjbR family)
MLNAGEAFKQAIEFIKGNGGHDGGLVADGLAHGKVKASCAMISLMLTVTTFNRFCKSLPHTSYVMQWGGAHVWKVGGAKGKVFAIAWDEGERGSHFTFKCSKMSYDILKEQEGLRPAPYLASRGMPWIQRVDDTSMDDAALKDYLRESHRLAAANLTKKLRLELGL